MQKYKSIHLAVDDFAHTFVKNEYVAITSITVQNCNEMEYDRLKTDKCIKIEGDIFFLHEKSDVKSSHFSHCFNSTLLFKFWKSIRELDKKEESDFFSKIEKK